MPEGGQAGASGRSRRIPPVWRTSLVADTDIAIGRLLRRDLPNEGFQVKVKYSGKAVLNLLRLERMDMVILGGDLPDMTALELIRRLNSKPRPPLLVLLESYRTDVVQVLDAGADDCMSKPIMVGELAARLRKLIRRHLQSRGVPIAIRTDTLELDCVLWRATVRGTAVCLTKKEQAALRMLVENAGRVVTSRDFMLRLWEAPTLSPRGRLASVIRHLRHKLDLTSGGPVRLLAVPQFGYRLVILEQSALPA